MICKSLDLTLTVDCGFVIIIADLDGRIFAITETGTVDSKGLAMLIDYAPSTLRIFLNRLDCFTQLFRVTIQNGMVKGFRLLLLLSSQRFFALAIKALIHQRV